MSKYLIFIALIFLFISPNIWGQEVEECKQINIALEHIRLNYIDKNDNGNERFNVDEEIQHSAGIPLLISEYYAHKMEIPLTEFRKLNSETKDSIYRINSENLMKIDSVYSIDCLRYENQKRPKIELRFTRIDHSSIIAWIININRNTRKHKEGKFLIFVFDNNNQIKKTFETNWME